MTSTNHGTRTPGRDDGLAVVPARVSDPLTRPLLTELEHEYRTRYGGGAADEMSRYPEEEFAPPHGLLLLLLRDGSAVAGGAYRRYDPATAELKRIWTHSAHRRRGLARRVVHELERAAAAHGYRRIFLTTGPRQPEARGLYLASGYTPLFDTEADPETIGPLAFEKQLPPPSPRPPKRPETPTWTSRPPAPPAPTRTSTTT